jgi:hypothetical protein
MRSYRKERCAIFIDPDSAEGFRESGLQTDFLDSDENAHLTGVQRKAHPKLKRIIVGDYDEWFRWFMKWQRFNAFHTVVLVAPIRRMIDDDRRGYFDGLLTRLLDKQSVHRVIVVEHERFHATLRKWLGGEGVLEEPPELKNRFGREQFVDAISSLLYGTLLSKRDLSIAAASTLYSKLNPAWDAGLLWSRDRTSGSTRPGTMEEKRSRASRRLRRENQSRTRSSRRHLFSSRRREGAPRNSAKIGSKDSRRFS